MANGRQAALGRPWERDNERENARGREREGQIFSSPRERERGREREGLIFSSLSFATPNT